MNNKGFTLVELLAVIIILAMLALITGTAVTKMVKDSKEDLGEIQEKNIIAAAKAWEAENLSKAPGEGECIFLTIKNLKDYGLLDSELIDPKTNKQIPIYTSVKITGKRSALGKITLDYKYIPTVSLANDCDYVYVIGDIDGNGELNELDSKRLVEIILGSSTTEYERLEADINGDGKLNALDSNLLKKLIDKTCNGSTMLGDVDNNCYVDQVDVELLSKGITHPELLVNRENADMNGDGKIDLIDVNLIKKYVQGM